MTMQPTNTAGLIGAAAAKPTKRKTPSQMMQAIVSAEGAKNLLENSLKENAGAFVSSIIDLYGTDTYLQNCDPAKVFQEALKAVSLKLPINKQLGFAYIIPRRSKGVWTPVFQLGYKGYIQLCMRTGVYKHINAGPVYQGELKGVDKLTGEVDLSGEPESDEVIGYFAYLETLNGFRKCLYWSKERLIAHAKRYSDSYKSGSAIWKDHFEEMAQKTVLRYLLSHWGIMSVELEKAFNAELAEMADAPLTDTEPMQLEPVIEAEAVDLDPPHPDAEPASNDEDTPF